MRYIFALLLVLAAYCTHKTYEMDPDLNYGLAMLLFLLAIIIMVIVRVFC